MQGGWKKIKILTSSFHQILLSPDGEKENILLTAEFYSITPLVVKKKSLESHFNNFKFYHQLFYLNGQL